VKRDKLHYEDLEDDNYSITYEYGFVAMVQMHSKYIVLDDTYSPKMATRSGSFYFDLITQRLLDK
jgi:hypothetical protein